MNICIGVLLCFAALGLFDKALGGRLGVAAELDRGLAAMGGLSLSMTGIYSSSSPRWVRWKAGFRR